MSSPTEWDCVNSSCHGTGVNQPEITGNAATDYPVLTKYAMNFTRPYINPCSTDPAESSMSCKRHDDDQLVRQHEPDAGDRRRQHQADDPRSSPCSNAWLSCGAPKQLMAARAGVLLTRLERRFGKLAVENLTTVIVGGMVLAFVLSYLQPSFALLLDLDLAKVAQGQVWRLVTFLFLPPSMSILWAFFAITITWTVGTSLEAEWGAFKFNLYYLLGALGTIVAALITRQSITNYYLNATLFLAFATVFPPLRVPAVLLPAGAGALARAARRRAARVRGPPPGDMATRAGDHRRGGELPPLLHRHADRPGARATSGRRGHARGWKTCAAAAVAMPAAAHRATTWRPAPGRPWGSGSAPCAEPARSTAPTSASARARSARPSAGRETCAWPHARDH